MQRERPTIELTVPQADFFTSAARYPAFVGGWGSGKTLVGILLGLRLSEQYPGNQGVIFRKNYTDLRDSTMADFQQVTRYKVRSDKTVKLPNGSKILFHHLDELAGVAQNINLGWFMIEQAEEFESDQVFQTLRGRLRRANVAEHKGFIIANTNGHNWIWRLWKMGNLQNAELFESTCHDNPHLPPEFVEDLEQMKAESPSHYRRFVLNSWEDTDTADRVMPYDTLLDAVGRDLRDYDDSLTVIACDPAEFGDDKSVIYVLKGLKVVYRKVTEKKSLMETAGNIVALHRQWGADKIIVDDVGVGSGVRASLRETLDSHNERQLVMGFNSGRQAEDRVHYVRMRDQVWGHAGDLFKDGYVSILPGDDLLVEELAAHTYAMNSKGQMQVCRKKDVKKELGHSPDRADALVMALWAAKKGRKRERIPELVAAGGGGDDYDPLTWEL